MDGANVLMSWFEATATRRAMQVAACVLFLALGFAVDAAETEAREGATTVVIEDPRPVAKAIAALVAQQGYSITYEDPPFAYSGDIVERAETRARRSLAPAGGSLILTLPPATQAATEQDFTKLLSKLIEAQSTSDRGGHFRLRQLGDEFHVIPSEVRNSNGEWVSQTSVLDAMISLPAQRRMGLKMLEDFCEALSKATNKHVVVGTFPANAVLSYDGTLNADEEEARSVLKRVLDATSRRLTWQLLYEPQAKWYFLNVLAVPERPSADSAAGKAKAPVSQRSGVAVSPQR